MNTVDKFTTESEIYVCGKVVTSMGGNGVDIEIYKIYQNESIPLNISVTATLNGNIEAGDGGIWVCANLSNIFCRGNIKLNFY